jgi:hypothetical protein
MRIINGLSAIYFGSPSGQSSGIFLLDKLASGKNFKKLYTVNARQNIATINNHRFCGYVLGTHYIPAIQAGLQTNTGLDIPICNTSNFSLFVLFYFRSLYNPTFQALYCKGANTTAIQGFITALNANQLLFSLASGVSTIFTHNNSIALYSGQLVLFIGTVDRAGVANSYINGKLINTTNIAAKAGEVINNTSLSTLCCYYNGTYPTYNPVICAGYCHGKILSSIEIAVMEQFKTHNTSILKHSFD